MQKYCPNWAVNHRKLPAKLLKGAIDEVWCFKAILILGIEIYFYLHTYDTMFQKLLRPTLRKNCSCDWLKLFQIWGWRAKILRSLQLFIQTVKDQKRNCDRILFYHIMYWRFQLGLIHTLEQIIRKTYSLVHFLSSMSK